MWCVCEREKCAHEGGNSNKPGQTERRFKLLGGGRDRTSLGCFWGWAGALRRTVVSFSVSTHARAYAHSLSFKSQTMHNPCRKFFACTKWARGTSGYWILTMKLQRLHSNGGDEVRSWDGNHKLILQTWQAACPWLPPNTALSSFTQVRKTSRGKKNTQFIIHFGSQEGHNTRRTHTICLILFWCHYCRRQQECNLHTRLFIGVIVKVFLRDLYYNVFHSASFVIHSNVSLFISTPATYFVMIRNDNCGRAGLFGRRRRARALTLAGTKERTPHSVANLITIRLCSVTQRLSGFQMNSFVLKRESHGNINLSRTTVWLCRAPRWFSHTKMQTIASIYLLELY